MKDSNSDKIEILDNKTLKKMHFVHVKFYYKNVGGNEMKYTEGFENEINKVDHLERVLQILSDCWKWTKLCSCHSTLLWRKLQQYLPLVYGIDLNIKISNFQTLPKCKQHTLQSALLQQVHNRALAGRTQQSYGSKQCKSANRQSKCKYLTRGSVAMACTSTPPSRSRARALSNSMQ